MRAVIQRVNKGLVRVNGDLVGQIGHGILALVGISQNDNFQDADYLVNKMVNLRIFEDSEGKLNRSLLDTKGELLLISQFTLYGDCRKGRRPSFTEAASVPNAQHLYDYLVSEAQKTGLRVQTGVFQATMDVELINNGPVTLLLDSHRLF